MRFRQHPYFQNRVNQKAIQMYKVNNNIIVPPSILAAVIYSKPEQVRSEKFPK